MEVLAFAALVATVVAAAVVSKEAGGVKSIPETFSVGELIERFCVYFLSVKNGI